MASSPHNPAPPHCTQEQRLEKLEKATDAHGIALTDGKIEFASIKKDLAAIQATLVKIEARLEKTGAGYLTVAANAAIFWIVPLVGGGILWAIFQAGKVPGVHS